MSTTAIQSNQTHPVGPGRINEAQKVPAQVESTSNSTMQSTASKTSLIWDIISLIIFPIALIRFAISIFSKSSCISTSNQESAIDDLVRPDSLEDLNALANAASLALTQKKDTITFKVSTSIDRLVEADTSKKVIRIHPFCFINPLSDLQEIRSLDFSVDEKGKFKHIKPKELVKWCREQWSSPSFQLRDLDHKNIQISELLWKKPKTAKLAIRNLIIREVILLKMSSQLRVTQIWEVVKGIINLKSTALSMGLSRWLSGSWKIALIQKAIGSVLQLGSGIVNLEALIQRKAEDTAVLLTGNSKAKNFFDKCKSIVEKPAVSKEQQEAIQRQQMQNAAAKKAQTPAADHQ